MPHPASVWQRPRRLVAAELLVTEGESLYVNGPAGGGGVRFSIRAAVHSRTGDKGDSQTLSVIAYEESDYPLLRAPITAEAVARHFASIVRGPMTRYEAALTGGVDDSLALDTRGKSRSSLLLDVMIDVPEDGRTRHQTGGEHV